jgi:tRNA pseudouridine55 synthase
LEAFRAERGLEPAVKLAYAGRLDPLASGLLPVLYGPMLAVQEEYWYLPKEYRVVAVLGMMTDSHDALGIPALSGHAAPQVQRVTAVVRGLVGKIDLSVPVYSSHRVDGKPLFSWVRETGDAPPAVPVRRMVISQADVGGVGECGGGELVADVLSRVSRVRGDFRQDAIRAAWEALAVSAATFTTLTMDIHCGSGTYIRSVVHELGRRLGCGAFVLSLRRTRVGPWRIDDPDVVRPAWPR